MASKHNPYGIPVVTAKDELDLLLSKIGAREIPVPISHKTIHMQTHRTNTCTNTHARMHAHTVTVPS